MNKVFRLLSSATLATGLVLGGSGAAFANDDYRDNNRSYDRDRDNNGHDNRDDRRHNNDYKYLYHCHDWKGDHWVVLSYKFDDDRKKCHLVAVFKKH